jgi:glycosyltransferase involved in cell wall biosynthesis
MCTRQAERADLAPWWPIYRRPCKPHHSPYVMPMLEALPVNGSGVVRLRRVIFVFERTLGHAVYARNLERSAADDADLDATVIAISPTQRRSVLAKLPVLNSWSWRASLSARAALESSLRRRRPDAVFIHTQAASLLATGIMRSVPTVVSMDATPVNYDSIAAGYGHATQSRFIERVKRSINRHAFNAASALVTWSWWAERSLVRDYCIEPDKIHVIRPGTDLQFFQPALVSRPRGLPRVLFVGADFRRKGGEELLFAMRRLAGKAELDIVTTSEVSAPRDSVQCRVHNGVEPGSPKLRELFRSADIFALPSRSECYGIAVTEAMAAGLPVVATRVGAIPELVTEGRTGFLVAPYSIRGLGRALERLIEDRAMRIEMGTEARLVAEREHDAGRNNRAILHLLATVATART